MARLTEGDANHLFPSITSGVKSDVSHVEMVSSLNCLVSYIKTVGGRTHYILQGVPCSAEKKENMVNSHNGYTNVRLCNTFVEHN